MIREKRNRLPIRSRLRILFTGTILPKDVLDGDLGILEKGESVNAGIYLRAYMRNRAELHEVENALTQALALEK